MSPYNGWRDSPEEEREWAEEEPQGELDPWEGWPEDTAGPEYWLYKGLMEGADNAEASRETKRRRRRKG